MCLTFSNGKTTPSGDIMSIQSTQSQRTSVKRTPRVCLSLFLLFDSVYKMDISLRQTSYSSARPKGACLRKS